MVALSRVRFAKIELGLVRVDLVVAWVRLGWVSLYEK